jgi:hypothetical protein
MSKPETNNYRIPKESFGTGITDARTYNDAMDRIDELLGGAGGDVHWREPVANVAALPPLGNAVGDARVTLDTLTIYFWNGLAWVTAPGSAPYETYLFGRAAAINNAYLRTVDGNPSNLTGYPMRKNSTVVAFSVAASAASVCTVEIYRSGAPLVPIDTLVLNGIFATKMSGVAIPVGDQLSCRINGGPAQRPVVAVIVE